MHSLGFYSEDELSDLGLRHFGKNVLISRRCSIYTPDTISLGDNVRIDDFSLLVGNITIGNYVHISAYAALYGKFGIEIGNFCGVSPKAIIFSASDDFSGEFMISPMVPKEFVNLNTGTVVLHDFCQVGAQSIIMPGVKMHEGAVCGAISLVKHDLDSWSIYAGIPCRKIKDRSTRAKKLSESIIGSNLWG